MSDGPWKWWPNWYVTRLHAVTANPPGAKQAQCGTWTVDPAAHRSPWRTKRLTGGVPKCKHCLRETTPPSITNEP